MQRDPLYNFSKSGQAREGRKNSRNAAQQPEQNLLDAAQHFFDGVNPPQ